MKRSISGQLETTKATYKHSSSSIAGYVSTLLSYLTQIQQLCIYDSNLESIYSHDRVLLQPQFQALPATGYQPQMLAQPVNTPTWAPQYPMQLQNQMPQQQIEEHLLQQQAQQAQQAQQQQEVQQHLMQGLKQLQIIFSPPHHEPSTSQLKEIGQGPSHFTTESEPPIMLKPPGLPEPQTPGTYHCNASPKPSLIALLIPKDFVLSVISLKSNGKDKQSRQNWHNTINWATMEQQEKWSHRLGSYLLDLISKDIIRPRDFLNILEDLKLEIRALNTVIKSNFKFFFFTNVGGRKDLTPKNVKVRKGNLLYLGHRFSASMHILEAIIKRLKQKRSPPGTIDRKDVLKLKDAIGCLHEFFYFCKPAKC